MLVIDFSYCYGSLINVPSQLHLYAALPRFILSATLLILAVTQTLRESVHMYQATKQWQPNRYMQQLAKDGVLYFLVYVFLFPFIHSLPSHSPAHVTLVLAEVAEKLTNWISFSEPLGMHFTTSVS